MRLLAWGHQHQMAVKMHGDHAEQRSRFYTPFHGRKREIFHGDSMRFHVEYFVEIPWNTTFLMAISCGLKHMKTPWRLHEILRSLRGISRNHHGVVIVFTRGMKIPWSISYGIPRGLHGKFCVSQWNSMGHKTRIAILQYRRMYLSKNHQQLNNIT